MTIRPSWLLLGLLLLAACATPQLSCQDSLGCFQIASDAPLTIAILAPADNEAAFLGDDIQLGVRLAIETADSQLLDHPIEARFFNSGCTETGGRTAAQDILAEGDIVAVIGPACAAVAAGSLPILTRANLTLLSPAVTHPDLTDPNATSTLRWRNGFYRLVPSFVQQAETAASYTLEQPDLQTAAIIHDDSADMQQLAATFNNSINRRSDIVTQTYIWTLNDAEAILDTLAETTPDLIYLALYSPDASQLVTGLNERTTLSQTRIIGNETWLQRSFAAEMQNISTLLYATGTHLTHRAAYLEWRARWQSALAGATQPNRVAYAYDATQLLLQAIQETAEQDSDGALLLGQSALREAIEQQLRSGITGSLRCDETGNCADMSSLALFHLNTPSGEWPPPTVWPTTP